MTTKSSLIKVGRQGVLIRGSRIPASFFRHLMPGKRFVVLAESDRRLMHIRATDLEALRQAYRTYLLELEGRSRRKHAKLTRS